MSDTTREAAERLRAVIGTPIEEWKSPTQVVTDMRTLAFAYVDEHDPTPVTKDWLEKRGFASDEGWGDGVDEWCMDLKHHDLTISVFDDLTAAIDLGDYFFECGTRGHIRRLCAALGIPLTTEDGK